MKYILLLGGGRNGKSLLLKMLQAIFGRDNCSNVTRQSIAEKSPVVTDLNGKLLNIVFDGPAEYLKDSGAEKTLIAGEPYPIRKLYDSAATTVQTNALYIEGLQHEPKTKDKSSALQKRLVRFYFPNVYALDHVFERRKLREEMTGALLSLLIDRYVRLDDVASALQLTERSAELQLEAMYANNLGLQFLKYLETHDAFGAEGLIGKPISDAAAGFQSWRLKENDYGSWSEPDVLALLTPLMETERKSDRQGNKVIKVRVVTTFKDEARQFIRSLKEDAGHAGGDPDVEPPVVED